MQIGMIGLGRMGANMVRRLQRAGHACVVYDRASAAVEALAKEGAEGAGSLAELVRKLEKPRTICIMVPAAVVDGTLADLLPVLDRGDAVVDGGNSHYHDDIARARRLAPGGIHYVDMGTSGGVWGLERGYCLMIGGRAGGGVAARSLLPGPRAGAGRRPPHARAEKLGGTAEEGYLHCGPAGAGHFVKMVHNGIEYGLMAAFAEGLNILRNANVGKRDHAQDAETAPLRNPSTTSTISISGTSRRSGGAAAWSAPGCSTSPRRRSPPTPPWNASGAGSRTPARGAGRWRRRTTRACRRTCSPRRSSSGSALATWTCSQNKVLSAMRFAFGGHAEGK